MEQFLEFRAVQDATVCMPYLQNITLYNRQLRVGRPADYKQPPPYLDSYIVPIPGHPASSHSTKLLQPNMEGVSLPSGMIADPSLLAAAEAAASPVQPSCAVVLQNILAASELESEEEYGEIVADIRSECDRFGEVKELIIPRPDRPLPAPADGSAAEGAVVKPSAVGKVFVLYASQEGAVAAKNALHGRSFNDKRVNVVFLDEAKFKARDFE